MLPYRLVAAGVGEVRAEHVVVLTDECVRAVPLVHAEICVEIVGQRVPGDEVPAHPRFHALDVHLRCARGRTRELPCRVLRCAGWATWSATMEQPMQACSGQPAHAGLEERAVDDQLAAPPRTGRAGLPSRALTVVACPVSVVIVNLPLPSSPDALSRLHTRYPGRAMENTVVTPPVEARRASCGPPVAGYRH